MKNLLMFVYLIIVLNIGFKVDVYAQSIQYPWLNNKINLLTVKDISLPYQFERALLPKESFGFWLRHLPLKSENNFVFLYNGKLKNNQNAHFKVLAIDVGNNNLQQCADAVIRLRAEYLFSRKKYNQIAFHFTNGDLTKFSEWAKGTRPVVKGNSVTWKQAGNGKADFSYLNFRNYLNSVFNYAGSYSLSKELFQMKPKDIKIGNVFINGGFPGHAIIIIDIAFNKSTKEKAILLAQSYMPAQEIHILKNPNNPTISPWYIVKKKGKLQTPEWTFNWIDLKRF